MLKKSVWLLSISLLLGACGNTAVEEPPAEESTTAVTDTTVETTEETTEETVSLSISIEVDEEEIPELSSDIEADAGETLMDVMVQEYDVEEEEGFLNSIEGYEQDPDSNRWWMYEINGEQPTVGANDYVVEDGDEVKWMLNELE